MKKTSKLNLHQDCPCDGQFPVKCSNNHCGINVKACEKIKSKSYKDKNFKPCPVFMDLKNKKKPNNHKNFLVF